MTRKKSIEFLSYLSFQHRMDCDCSQRTLIVKIVKIVKSEVKCSPAHRNSFRDINVSHYVKEFNDGLPKFSYIKTVLAKVTMFSLHGKGMQREIRFSFTVLNWNYYKQFAFLKYQMGVYLILPNFYFKIFLGRRF